MATSSKKSASKKTKTVKKSTKASSSSATKKTTSKKVITAPVQKVESKKDESKTSSRSAAGSTRFSQFKTWNLALAVINAAQAVAIYMLSKANRGVYPITTNYTTTDNLASTPTNTVVVNATRHLLDVHVVWLIVAYFAVAAITHLSLATWYRRKYQNDLKNEVNRARWIEYILTNGIMLLVISYLVGISDISTLVAIFVLSALMNMVALKMELLTLRGIKPSRLSYVISVIAGLTPWLILAIYAFGAHQFGAVGLPKFVYLILAIQFVLSLLCAVNTNRRFKATGRWNDYLFAEKVYMVLGLIGKAALAWLVFKNVLHI